MHLLIYIYMYSPQTHLLLNRYPASVPSKDGPGAHVESAMTRIIDVRLNLKKPCLDVFKAI